MGSWQWPWEQCTRFLSCYMTVITPQYKCSSGNNYNQAYLSIYLNQKRSNYPFEVLGHIHMMMVVIMINCNCCTPTCKYIFCELYCNRFINIYFLQKNLYLFLTYHMICGLFNDKHFACTSFMVGDCIVILHNMFKQRVIEK